MFTHSSALSILASSEWRLTCGVRCSVSAFRTCVLSLPFKFSMASDSRATSRVCNDSILWVVSSIRARLQALPTRVQVRMFKLTRVPLLVGAGGCTALQKRWLWCAPQLLDVLLLSLRFNTCMFASCLVAAGLANGRADSGPPAPTDK
jgi:hypothetical protein